MPEDRSLDEFAPVDENADSDDAADPAAVDPAVATSTWHADGAACDRCGEPVERRWRDEGDFVCADCASW
ncbi:hypothetical protein [Halorubrum trapanicum]|uniref:DUF7573 domain-containing protein n=1 Tax=Halorubrum trapanicum TaxID=29284 RepID=UPI000BBACD10|nr:hypothetical protein [Halorubrum trapanicum]